MKGVNPPQASITVTLGSAGRSGGQRVKLTTWGVRNGVYGSLGVVYVPVPQMDVPETQADLARLLLTALYGLDYDL